MAVRTITAEPMRAMADALADCDDGKLMARVAESHDAEAFGEFLRRHQSAAFNLACYLTRNRDEAEEVLQDAFLKVWRHADDFRDEGNARNWLLKIVARETFRQRERNRSNEEKKVRAQHRGPARTADAPDQGAEHEELLGALRIHLQDLPEDERRAVALYYGAGCTQEEIGEALACSQNRISHLLNQALGKLRTRLTQAGYAAALPLLAEDGLRNALCGGAEAPASVAAAVLRSLKTGVAEHSRRAAAAKGGLGAGAYVAAALALAGAGAWWALGNPAAAPSAPGQQGTPATVQKTPAPLPEPARGGVEVVYEDEFAGTAIDGFWEKTTPAPRRGYSTVDLDNEKLALFTGTKEAFREMPEGTGRKSDKVFPEVSIATKAIPLNGQALLFQTEGRGMNNNAGYELYLELLDGEGRLLGGNCQSRRTTADPVPLFHRFVVPSADSISRAQVPVEIGRESLGLLVDAEGEINEIATDGSLIPYGRHGQGPKSVRFQLRAKTVGEKSYMIWAFDRCRVLRISDLTDPKRLVEAADSPWESKVEP